MDVQDTGADPLIRDVAGDYDIRGAGEALVRVDRHGVIRGVSPAFRALLGYSREALAGRMLGALLRPDQAHRLRRLRQRLDSHGRVGNEDSTDLVWLDSAGRPRHTRVRLTPSRREPLIELRIVAATGLPASEPNPPQPQPRQAWPAAALAASATGMLVVDRNAVVRFANAAAVNTLDTGREELAGESLDVALGGVDFPGREYAMGRDVAALLDAGEQVGFDAWGLIDQERVVELRVVPLPRTLEPLALLELRDITETRQREAELRYLSQFDALTGLPNRSLFLSSLREACERRDNAELVVAHLDVDRFKRLNEAFGPRASDDILREVAERLRELVGPTGTVGRLGSDEFGVLVQGGDAQGRFREMRAVMENVMGAPMYARGREVFATVSCGWVGADGGAPLEPEALLAHAEAARYAAKKRGPGSVIRYSPEMESSRPDRVLLEVDLRHALAREEFEVHYQPVFQLDSGECSGVEALLRWRRPDGLDISPSEFVPVLEETGLIRTVGAWLLERACRELLQADGHGQGRMLAINVSAEQMRDGDFAGGVDEMLRHTGFPPSRLVMEITESLLMESSMAVQRNLACIDRMGVALAVDDFGTGYSSLAYLKHFPVDILKIDRSFVAGLPDSPDDQAIVGAVMAIAASLGLTVIAEGVESQRQAEYLQRWPGTLVQGYLYARPAPLAAPFPIPAVGHHG